MQHSDNERLDRRSFLGAAGAVVAGSAFPSSALSYGRILGANDRIALGHIGVGNRGTELHAMVSRLKDKYNVETVAVCDLWKNNRERAAANTEQLLRPARQRRSSISRICWRRKTSTR